MAACNSTPRVPSRRVICLSCGAVWAHTIGANSTACCGLTDSCSSTGHTPHRSFSSRTFPSIVSGCARSRATTRPTRRTSARSCARTGPYEGQSCVDFVQTGRFRLAPSTAPWRRRGFRPGGPRDRASYACWSSCGGADASWSQDGTAERGYGICRSVYSHSGPRKSAPLSAKSSGARRGDL